MRSPEWLRDKETGRQEEDLCCQGEHLLPGPWDGRQGTPGVNGCLQEPHPKPSGVSAVTPQSLLPVSPILCLRREKGMGRIGSEDEVWCGGSRK